MNLKFLRNLKALLKGKGDATTVHFRTCGLHTVHCVFKAAMTATGCNIVQFLRALYNLVKDLPARRGNFIVCTQQECFPNVKRA